MHKPKRVSIKDIARASGVSHSTVSRALNDSPLISEAVRRRVQDLARDMGYMPNALARSLQGQRSLSVGLVVTTIADPFVADLVEGVEKVARAAGISLFLSTSQNDPAQEIEAVSSFHRRRVDGVIVAASRVGGAYADHLERIRVPVVLVNSQAERCGETFHFIEVDDYAGACLAMQHLIGLGHRRIGYLGVANRPRSSQLRLAAYRDSLLENRIELQQDWICIDVSSQSNAMMDDIHAGYGLASGLLETGVTAAIAYNDRVATGALLACREAGVNVPGEFSVIGFDDVALAQIIVPPLTTIHQPKLELGEQAMRMLLDLIGGKQDVQDLVLPARLVIRGSTASPPGRSNAIRQPEPDYPSRPDR